MYLLLCIDALRKNFSKLVFLRIKRAYYNRQTFLFINGCYQFQSLCVCPLLCHGKINWWIRTWKYYQIYLIVNQSTAMTAVVCGGEAAAAVGLKCHIYLRFTNLGGCGVGVSRNAYLVLSTIPTYHDAYTYNIIYRSGETHRQIRHDDRWRNKI